MSVRRRVALAIAAGALPAILFAARVLPGSRAVAVGIVLLATVAFAELFRAVRTTDERHVRASVRFERALRPRDVVDRRPAELDRLERELVLGAASAEWARHGLLPRLRTAAAARLSARHGIDLERSPQAARDLLGEDTWELVRPDRPAPTELHARGIPLARVEAVLERLESL